MIRTEVEMPREVFILAVGGAIDARHHRDGGRSLCYSALMDSKEEVRRLSALARIQVPEEEVASFAADFESILGYVGQLESLQVSAAPDAHPTSRNVLREDGTPHETGIYTEKLIEQFRDEEKGALKVRQIISND